MQRERSRVTLIHNEAAGEGDHSRFELVELLSSAGYCATASSINDPNLERILERPAKVIVIAGGDGAVTTVVRHAKPNGSPLAILPLGTANNIAASLGINGAVGEIIKSWKEGKPLPFYPLSAEGPWGRTCIVEGIGFGCIEQAIKEMGARKPDVDIAREWIAETILGSPSVRLDVQLDSKTLSGSFALIEITSIPFVGPNLHLAPSADPSDRRIHVSVVGDDADQRTAFSQWLLHADRSDVAPVVTRAARRVVIHGSFDRIRINDRVRDWHPNEGDKHGSIVVEAEAQPLHFLVSS